MKKEGFVNLIGVLMLVVIIGGGLFLVFRMGQSPVMTSQSPIFDEQKNGHDGEAGSVKTYVIDSCEYIGRLGTAYSDVLAHKGNCRFCEKRK